MAGLRGGALQQCVSVVELRIECRDLVSRDAFSHSDPCAVLFVHDGDEWVEEGRTETIVDQPDPQFTTYLSLDYHFETVQSIRIAIYDIDNSSDSLKDDDFQGRIECTLGQLVSSSPFRRPLLSKKGKQLKSTIIVLAEEIKSGTESVEMQFRARKLDNKDFMGKSDPFLQISSEGDDGETHVVWETEVVENCLNPEWEKFSVRMKALCGGDKSKPILFDVYDCDKEKPPDLIGSFDTTLNDMLEARGGEIEWPCINEKKAEKKKKYKDSGKVILCSIEITQEYSFLDYIFGGLHMNLSVAIDFTGSNGDPRDANSLHYIHPEYPNEYVQAINAVGHVIQDYDTDKLFPVLGFGACLPPAFNETHFEFAVNFNPQNPFCAGVPGIVQAYQSCITQVQLSGPTNVAPVINHVARFAQQAQEQEMQDKGAHAYFVLLILTDGAVTDMDQTTDAIVKASSLPMSIIIVGVGDDDFSLMDFLDGDDGVLRSLITDECVQRDIVQFVPFIDFKESGPGQLARQVLAEIPNQVVEYFRIRGLPPNTPVAAPPPNPSMAAAPGMAAAQGPYPGTAGAPGTYPGMAGAPGPYPGMAGAPGPYPGAAGAPAPYPGAAGAPGSYPGMPGAPGPYPGTAGAPGSYPGMPGAQAPYPGAPPQ